MTSTDLAAAFAKLGVAADADARAVRQAYARLLKQIDHSTDIEAFHALRAAYELVLNAVQRGPDVAAPGSVAPVTAASPAPIDVLVDDFMARLGGLASVEDAAALLQQTQARLTGLEAGMWFEWHVAELLAWGWRPGHEFLFDAASSTFHWGQDRRHMQTLGNIGLLLQEALIEQQEFLAQPDRVLERQRKVVARLRDATPPSATLLRDEKLMVTLLVRRFPHWLGVVTSMAHVEQWLGGPAALQAARAMPSLDTDAGDSSDDRRFSDWQVISLLLGLAYVAWRHFG